MAVSEETWTEIVLSTEGADRAQAEAGIEKCYRELGLTRPKIVWCTSPMRARLVQTILVIQGKLEPPTLTLPIETLAPDNVRARIEDDSTHLNPPGFTSASLRRIERIISDALDNILEETDDSLFGTAWDLAKDIAKVCEDQIALSSWAELAPSERLGLKDAADRTMKDKNLGGFWSISFSWLRYLIRTLSPENAFWQSFLQISRSAGWMLPHNQICFICERPSVHSFDDRGFLHCDSGPSIAFAADWKTYHWHGIRVSENVIEKPETITLEAIENEGNVAVRHVMTERYGVTRYLFDSGAEEIHRDEFGILFRQKHRNDHWRCHGPCQRIMPITVRFCSQCNLNMPRDPREPVVMVKVINQTADPSGQQMEFFLRVPPSITTARAAVAWTFAMDPEQYQPRQET